EGICAPLDHRAVLDRGEGVAHDDGAGVGEELGDEEAVAERLAHLGAALGDPCGVHPQPGELVAGGAGLGLLVLVVREAQVEAAAVDVERGAEVAPGHRGALEVPAWAAAAVRGGPRCGLGLTWAAGLPER